jgi:hypothetical protein
MLVEGAYQLDFPNTGIAALPEIGVVALMNRQVRSAQCRRCLLAFIVAKAVIVHSCIVLAR